MSKSLFFTEGKNLKDASPIASDMSDVEPNAEENDTYHCSILTHSIIKSMEDKMAWPSTPDDIS